MSKTKLVSLNMGISLVIQKDGKEQKVSYSCTFPSKSFRYVREALQAICEFVNDEFGTEYHVNLNSDSPNIQIAKVKQEKPAPSLTHEEFNQKIKELVS